MRAAVDLGYRNIDTAQAYQNERGVGEGLRACGVARDELFDSASVKPMLNQILAHVSNRPFDLIDDTKGRGMVVEAYSPFGHGQILTNGEIAAMAAKYDVGIPQLCIRYCLQLGLLPLPKTANPDHMRTKAAVDFVISDSDMDALKNATPIKDYGDASVFPVYRKTA